MRKNQKGFGLVVVLVLIVIVVLAAGIIGFFVYRSQQNNNKETESAIKYDSTALMTVTSSGGLCASACNHPIYNLYDNGNFDGHKKLNGDEVFKLKNIIDSTDFLKYKPNPNPQCESFVDGSDQVLLFPQKYGDKTFTTCMLDIPANDPAFTYIDRLLESHYIQPH